jgi:hypothetical protein
MYENGGNANGGQDGGNGPPAVKISWRKLGEKENKIKKRKKT